MTRNKKQVEFKAEPSQHKLDKNFKLSKTAKRVLALMGNREQQEQYKRMVIDAELTAKHSEYWIMK